MPSQKDAQPTSPGRRQRACTALTTSGVRCKRVAVAGLTVCKSHGGGTAASVRVGKRASISRQAHSLWGISSDASGVSVVEELTKLARNKMTDILALRIKISGDDVSSHIGVLRTGSTTTEYDIEGTVQSKEGTQKTTTRSAGTSVWVQELHKTEMELVQILKLLQEVTGGTDEVDVRRLRIQTARESVRLAKAFPGMGVDEIAFEIARKAS